MTLQGSFWWTVDEFKQLKLPQPTWTLPGWLPGSGFTLLFAPGKTGKSLLAAQLSDALSQGQAILGAEPDRAWRVLYVQADASRVEWQAQLQSVLPWPTKFATCCPPKYWLDLEPERSRIISTIRESQAEFVWFDALDGLSASHDCESITGFTILDSKLRTIMGEKPYGLIHHPRRIQAKVDYDQTNPRNTYAGSRALLAGAASLIALEWDNALSRGTARIVNRFGPDKEVYLQRDPVGRWELAAPLSRRAAPLAIEGPISPP